jgi:signal transduction histidine kinase
MENQLLRSREQLQQLSVHLESVREEERLRISREVHDGLGQALTALKFDISSIKHNSAVPRELLLKLTSMEETVNETIGSIQRIVAELRPRLLDDLGLVAAIQWQTDDFRKRTNISCRVELCGDPQVKPECSLAIIRILQEALANIVRHAEATEVTVTLTIEPGELVFAVADNGNGMTPDHFSKADAYGLMGMRERAIACDGTVDIESQVGEGTTIRMRVPIENNMEE